MHDTADALKISLRILQEKPDCVCDGGISCLRCVAASFYALPQFKRELAVSHFFSSLKTRGYQI